MMTAAIFEAKACLSELIRNAQSGENGDHQLRTAENAGSEARGAFDRIIAAHVLAEDIPVISADPKLDAFGVRRLW